MQAGYSRDWIYNPPSLRLVCVSRIRRSMSSLSCMGQKIERNFIETLTTGDLDDLRNSNVPISLEDMCKYYILRFLPLQTLKADFVTAFTVPSKGGIELQHLNRWLNYNSFHESLYCMNFDTMISP